MEVSTGLIVLEVVFFLFKLWAMVTCLRRPGWAFERAGSSKALWIGLLGVGFFLPLIGWFVALWYLFSTDRMVRRQLRLGPGIGFPGGHAPIG